MTRAYKGLRYDEDWSTLPDPDCRVDAIAEEYADLIIEWGKAARTLIAVEMRTHESGPITGTLGSLRDLRALKGSVEIYPIQDCPPRQED